MLGDVGHLLLLCQHLNLHLLLFGQRHEVVKNVFLVLALLSSQVVVVHIFASPAVVEVLPISRSVPSIRLSTYVVKISIASQWI